MARIVVDTNIIARAVALPHGLAWELFQRSQDDAHLLCTSTYMLAELDRVLRYPKLRKMHGLSDLEIEEFVQSVQRVSLVVELGSEKIASVSRDLDDDPIIETAIRAKVSYLCSNDLDLHATEVVEHCRQYDIAVVTNRQIMNIFRKSPPP
ncbi:MAG: putative toxin-antitoxin system toxin component, PIN family [Pirellulaceae bacterium]|nr:putative toxin-antitoxin system toxin component, PIN family [Pirellulaceae bacterium]